MLFVPSPIKLHYDFAYQARANESGRMQYYKVLPGKSRSRISRGEFIEAFNSSKMVGLRPIQDPSVKGLFQIEFFVANKIS